MSVNHMIVNDLQIAYTPWNWMNWIGIEFSIAL